MSCYHGERRPPAHETPAQPVRSHRQLFYILWFLCFRKFFFFSFFLFKSPHKMNEEKRTCHCLLGFLVQPTQPQHIMPFPGRSEALCELPSESKTKQTTCLSKDFLLALASLFILYCPFVHQLCYAFYSYVFLTAGVASRRIP